MGRASPDDDRRRVTERTARFADAIAARGLIAALEFHPYTLTETAASANELLDHARPTEPQDALATRPCARPPMPRSPSSPQSRRTSRTCTPSPGVPAGIDDRRALADGVDLWPPAFALADRDGAPLPGRRYALCEYVRDDDPEQLVADVRVLRSWLDALPDPREP